MAVYQASVFVETLTITANSEEEANAKYDAWHLNQACPSCFPVDIQECGCVEHDEEVGNTMERIAD